MSISTRPQTFQNLLDAAIAREASLRADALRVADSLTRGVQAIARDLECGSNCPSFSTSSVAGLSHTLGQLAEAHRTVCDLRNAIAWNDQSAK